MKKFVEEKSAKGPEKLFTKKEEEYAEKILFTLNGLTIDESFSILEKCKKAILQCPFTLL